MSRWQCIVRHRRYHFLSKLLFYSTLGHLTLLLIILFFYKGENFTQKLTLDVRNDMKVMFLPFQKTTALASQISHKNGGRTVSQVANKQSKSSQKLNTSKTKATSKSKTAITEGAQKKNVVEKKKPKKEVKKESTIPPKKVKEKPKPIKKEEPVIETIDFAQENVAYLGQNDLGTLELKRELLSEIEQAWHPPLGIASGKSCKVRVLVGWQGTVEEILFEEPSNITAFDASVRHALLTMKFPKSSFGKELILPFH